MEERKDLDEETLAHFEHTSEFMIACLIVNEPPQYLQILATVFDLLTCFFELAMRVRTGIQPFAILKGRGQLRN